jgi:hypothetical protein
MQNNHVYILVAKIACLDNWKAYFVNRIIEAGINVEVLCLPTAQPCCIPKLLNWQLKIERKLVADVVSIIPQFHVECIDAQQHYDLLINLTTCADSQLLKNYDVERVWSLHYRDRLLCDAYDFGVAEQVYKLPCVDIQLIECLGDKLELVDVAKFTRHWSILKVTKAVHYGIHDLVIRNLKADRKQPKYTAIPTPPYNLSEYILPFYGHLLTKSKWALLGRFFKRNSEHWTVAIGEGSALDQSLTLHKYPQPTTEFWADPFLFEHAGKTYLFFEKFPYNTKRGIISVAEIIDNRPENVRDILVKPYHLSYPFLIEEDGDIFMIPECSENNRLEVYRAVEFPDKWELYSTAFEGEKVADTVCFRNKDGKLWLLTGVSDQHVCSHCYKLNAYMIDSLRLNKITPHNGNPVVFDASKARNGGRVYTENGRLYRVGQDNTYGMYGHGVCISEITELSLDSYTEVEVKRIDTPVVPDMIGTHQMCQIPGKFVIDVLTQQDE